jgi:predicted SnoaL-like aldol condensation-catalyzing enzyme
MKHIRVLTLSMMMGFGLLASAPVFAQEAVVGVDNAEALFTSPDPQLNANKQVVLHIVRDLLEAGHWDQADQYISEAYIQHNPQIPSGRATVVDFFTKVLKVEPKPIPEKMQTKVVAVLAEGDLVTVVYPRNVEAKGDVPAYTTTWFDMWRIKDGKAVEHWDPALK